MEKIGMFWGSNTGNQEEAAGFLKDFMESEGVEMDEYNIADTDPSKMLEYKRLIIGCPTWHIGELQDDWDFIYEKYKELDFSGITAAFLAAGIRLVMQIIFWMQSVYLQSLSWKTAVLL